MNDTEICQMSVLEDISEKVRLSFGHSSQFFFGIERVKSTNLGYHVPSFFHKNASSIKYSNYREYRHIPSECSST